MQIAQMRWGMVKIVMADVVKEVQDALESSAEWMTDDDESRGHLTLIPGGMQ